MEAAAVYAWFATLDDEHARIVKHGIDRFLADLRKMDDESIASLARVIVVASTR